MTAVVQPLNDVNLAAVAGLSYEVMEAQRSGSFSGPYENADIIVSRENLERLLESL